MKIKIIKDSEVVIKRNEYNILQQVYKQYGDIINAVNSNCTTYYYLPCEGNCTIVKMFNNGYNFPIKKFDSDDQEYNRVCADELVELLRQKQ